MKRCPTCQSTYTNDALRFCLQDGAALLSMSDASSNRAASEETLEISGGQQKGFSQDAPGSHPAATVKIPAPALTAVEEQSFRTPSTNEPQPSQGGTPPRQTNMALVVGMTAIAVLLLVLVGIGIALLMRGRWDGRRNRTTEANANTSQRNDNQDSDPANANQQGRSRRPDMTGDLSPQGARVEAKILRGASVSQNDIAGLGRAELRRLRNTVYARHGRVFERMELQQYFDGRSWYKRRDNYTDDELTPVDRDNINLIRTAEDRSP